jgi:hypothetical protein
VSLADEFRTAEQRVAYLLERWPELRDSDKKLYLTYLNQFHGLKARLESAKNPYPELKAIFLSDDTLSFNTIRRVRAKFQAGGLYHGSKAAERAAQAEEAREYFGGAP